MALKLGISKQSLMDDYYPDELPLIFTAYAELVNPADRTEEAYADELW